MANFYNSLIEMLVRPCGRFQRRVIHSIERFLFLGSVILSALISADTLSAQPNGDFFGKTPIEQILVLKNGEMLLGRIEQDNANLVIHTQQGSRLVISKQKADFICDTPSEAFWGKAANIRASDTGAQVRLFQWCLRYNLLNLAEDQLRILMETDISSQQLASLNRQLSMLRSRQTRGLAEGREKKAEPKHRIAQSDPSTVPSGVGPAASLAPLPLTFRPLPKDISTNRPGGPASNKSNPASNSRSVQLASFEVAVKDGRESAKHASRFSTAGQIPDLNAPQKQRRQKTIVPDPYDPARFNAETARRDQRSGR